MEILLNPNIAYLLLVIGLSLALLSLMSPGTGILEIGALVSLLLAGWAMINLPINWWAFLILLVGLVFFYIAIRQPQRLFYLAISITALVVGSAFMFSSGEWYVPAVNPFLALVVSIITAGFFWLVARKVVEAMTAQPVQDLTSIIGEIGVAKSDIHEEGSVQVAGELWTARSDNPIRDGSQIRVIGRDGFILEVEKIASSG